MKSIRLIASSAAIAALFCIGSEEGILTNQLGVKNGVFALSNISAGKHDKADMKLREIDESFKIEDKLGSPVSNRLEQLISPLQQISKDIERNVEEFQKIFLETTSKFNDDFKEKISVEKKNRKKITKETRRQLRAVTADSTEEKSEETKLKSITDILTDVSLSNIISNVDTIVNATVKESEKLIDENKTIIFKTINNVYNKLYDINSDKDALINLQANLTEIVRSITSKVNLLINDLYGLVEISVKDIKPTILDSDDVIEESTEDYEEEEGSLERRLNDSKVFVKSNSADEDIKRNCKSKIFSHFTNLIDEMTRTILKIEDAILKIIVPSSLKEGALSLLKHSTREFLKDENESKNSTSSDTVPPVEKKIDNKCKLNCNFNKPNTSVSDTKKDSEPHESDNQKDVISKADGRLLQEVKLNPFQELEYVLNKCLESLSKLIEAIKTTHFYVQKLDLVNNRRLLVGNLYPSSPDYLPKISFLSFNNSKISPLNSLSDLDAYTNNMDYYPVTFDDSRFKNFTILNNTFSIDKIEALEESSESRVLQSLGSIGDTMLVIANQIGKTVVNDKEVPKLSKGNSLENHILALADKIDSSIEKNPKFLSALRDPLSTLDNLKEMSTEGLNNFNILNNTDVNLLNPLGSNSILDSTEITNAFVKGVDTMANALYSTERFSSLPNIKPSLSMKEATEDVIDTLENFTEELSKSNLSASEALKDTIDDLERFRFKKISKIPVNEIATGHCFHLNGVEGISSTNSITKPLYCTLNKLKKQIIEFNEILDTLSVKKCNNATNKITEAPVEGIKATEAPVEGIKATEAPAEGIKATEAPAEGIKATEAPVEGIKATEAPVEGIKATEAPAEGIKATEAPAEDIKATEASTNDKKKTTTDFVNQFIKKTSMSEKDKEVENTVSDKHETVVSRRLENLSFPKLQLPFLDNSKTFLKGLSVNTPDTNSLFDLNTLQKHTSSALQGAENAIQQVISSFTNI